MTGTNGGPAHQTMTGQPFMAAVTPPGMRAAGIKAFQQFIKEGDLSDDQIWGMCLAVYFAMRPFDGA